MAFLGVGMIEISTWVYGDVGYSKASYFLNKSVKRKLAVGLLLIF